MRSEAKDQPPSFLKKAVDTLAVQSKIRFHQQCSVVVYFIHWVSDRFIWHTPLSTPNQLEPKQIV